MTTPSKVRGIEGEETALTTTAPLPEVRLLMTTNVGPEVKLSMMTNMRPSMTKQAMLSPMNLLWEVVPEVALEEKPAWMNETQDLAPPEARIP